MTPLHDVILLCAAVFLVGVSAGIWVANRLERDAGQVLFLCRSGRHLHQDPDEASECGLTENPEEPR